MEKSTWIKLGAAVGAILIIVLLSLIIKRQHDQLTSQADLQKSRVEMKQLQDGIIRSQAQLISKEDLERFADESGINLDPIRSDLENLNAQIRAISSLVVRTPGFSGHNIPSTGTTPNANQVQTPIECKEYDKWGYQANAQSLVIKEPMSDGTSVPFGEAEFKAWEKDPWNLSIFPREYSVTTVIGQDEDGRHYTYHKFNISSNGSTYPTKIDESKLVEELPAAKFRFSPRLYVGVDAGGQVSPLPAPEVTLGAQAMLFSYGQTKANPTWTFGGVGLGYETQSHHINLNISPVNYNVGGPIPLVDNLHLGPSISLNTSGGISVMGGLRVGL